MARGLWWLVIRRAGLYFHDVVRGGLALAGGGDAGEAGPGAQGGEIRGAEVAHAGLETADELRHDAVERGGDFF